MENPSDKAHGDTKMAPTAGSDAERGNQPTPAPDAPKQGGPAGNFTVSDPDPTDDNRPGDHGQAIPQPDSTAKAQDATIKNDAAPAPSTGQPIANPDTQPKGGNSKAPKPTGKVADGGPVDGPQVGQSVQYVNGEHTMAAIVTEVYSKDMVNLFVFPSKFHPEGNDPRHAVSVNREGAQGGYPCWRPIPA